MSPDWSSRNPKACSCSQTHGAGFVLCLVFTLHTMAFALQLRKNHGETSVSVSKICLAEQCWAGFTAGLRAHCIYFGLYSFSLKMAFRNSKLWRLTCHIEPCSVHQERFVCWKDGDVMLGSGRGLCG